MELPGHRRRAEGPRAPRAKRAVQKGETRAMIYQGNSVRESKAYPPDKIANAVNLARKTTIMHAAKVTKISTFTIRRHLILAGHKPKKQGKRAKIYPNVY